MDSLDDSISLEPSVDEHISLYPYEKWREPRALRERERVPRKYRLIIGTPIRSQDRLIFIMSALLDCNPSGHVGFADIAHSMPRAEAMALASSHLDTCGRPDMLPAACAEQIGDARYLAIFRLGIEEQFRRRGAATRAVEWIERYAQENHFQYVVAEQFQQRNGAAAKLFLNREYTFGMSAFPYITEHWQTGLFAWKQLTPTK